MDGVSLFQLMGALAFLPIAIFLLSLALLNSILRLLGDKHDK